MPNSSLNKKSLNQLDVVNTLSDDDNILVERNGRIKRFNAENAIGSNIYILDLSLFNYIEDDSGGGGGPM